MQPLRRSKPQPTHLPLRRRRTQTAAAEDRSRSLAVPGRLVVWVGAGILVGAVTLSLLRWPGETGALARLDGLVADAGLAITQVSVTGLDRALPDDVFAAIAQVPQRSILAFDSVAAEAKLEALPWVKSASIARVLPGELTVRIAERRPFAVWQNRQMPFLIDEDGHALEPVAPSDHPELPVVAGAGAAEEARAMLTLLARFPAIREQVGAVVRIAGRRWTLKLRNGPDVMLAAGDPEASLIRLEALERQHKILARQLAAIDLRLPGRIVLRASGSSG